MINNYPENIIEMFLIMLIYFKYYLTKHEFEKTIKLLDSKDYT